MCCVCCGSGDTRPHHTQGPQQVCSALPHVRQPRSRRQKPCSQVAVQLQAQLTNSPSFCTLHYHSNVAGNECLLECTIQLGFQSNCIRQ